MKQIIIQPIRRVHPDRTWELFKAYLVDNDQGDQKIFPETVLDLVEFQELKHYRRTEYQVVELTPLDVTGPIMQDAMARLTRHQEQRQDLIRPMYQEGVTP